MRGYSLGLHMVVAKTSCPILHLSSSCTALASSESPLSQCN